VKNALRLTAALLLVGLIGYVGCSQKVTKTEPDPLAMCGIGINGHFDKLSGLWTAPYIVTKDGMVIGEFWTMQEAIKCAKENSR
jgi:hypothetical protein